MLLLVLFPLPIPLSTGLRTHAQWVADYNAVRGDSDDMAASDFNKIRHPVLIDYGPANFKLATAIGLIQRYQQANPGGSDPLSLGQYFNHYDDLVRDLIDPASSATEKLYGLMIREADRFFIDNSAYGADWENLPQAFKDSQ